MERDMPQRRKADRSVSYCRWSSDDYLSDVYVYEDCYGGWTTHVAGSKRIYTEPLPPVVEWGPREDQQLAYMRRFSEVGDWPHELVPIGLPHDGKTYNDDTPGECASRLVTLRAIGYKVPQYAIDALREESADMLKEEVGHERI